MEGEMQSDGTLTLSNICCTQLSEAQQLEDSLRAGQGNPRRQSQSRARQS